MPAVAPGAAVAPVKRWRFACTFAAVEDAVLALALAGMVLLPIAEIVLRATLQTGIENVVSLVQHLALLAGTIGAAVAARERSLLSFAGVSILGGRTEVAARAFASAVSAGICSLLAAGSLAFVSTERAAGAELAYGLPAWLAQLAIPAAFLLIALRLVRDGAAQAPARAIVVAGAAACIGAVLFLPIPVEIVRPAALVLIGLAAVCGAPVFVAVGGAALVLLWSGGVPAAALAVDHYSLVSNPSLPAIPLFTLAGYLLAESRAPARLIELFSAWFGRVPGGAALATVLACTFFTAFTGASGVTILALGGLLMPLLVDCGYSRRDALGLVTAGGSAGVLLLPALPLILYAIVAKISIEDMFLGGALPALLMLGICAGWGIARRGPAAFEPAFELRRALLATWTAKWELLLPLVVFGGLFSGLMTPLESAAVTALYAFIVAVVIHRDLSLLRDVPRVLVQCGLMVGGILLILGVALGLTNYMVDAQISERALEWVTGNIHSPWLFLLALNGMLLLVGCLVDIFSAIIVVVPLVAPMGAAYGIDPVHLGIIFLANLELGYLTPPVGMNLFFASSRFRRPILEVCRAVVPVFLWLAAGVLVVTYLPFLSTALPGLR